MSNLDRAGGRLDEAEAIERLRRGDIDLRFRDVPYYYPEWKTTRGLVPPEEERFLAALRAEYRGLLLEVAARDVAAESRS